MNLDQTAPLGSSLIWVHIVCNIDYLRACEVLKEQKLENCPCDDGTEL